MGTVYLAYDKKLDRPVALKFPHIELAWFPATIDRLLREARTAGRFHDRSFCTIYDIDQIEGRHYIAMEYIEGRPLKSIIDPERPLPQVQVAQYVLSIALAMGRAHDRGILHRDLKPSNVMINQRGELVILDFGLALRLDSDDPELTAAGQRLGTPHYMAPEQVLADKMTIGPPADVWALGVILYQMLTGQLPFLGRQAEVYSKILTQSPLPPRSLRTDLDGELESICLKAIAKPIDERYSSMTALAQDLDNWITGRRGGPSIPKPKARPPLQIVLAGVALMCLLGISAWFVRFPAPPEHNNAPTPIEGRAKEVDPLPSVARQATPPNTNSLSPGIARVIRNSIGINLVHIEPGTFSMGSVGTSGDEVPSHSVTISRGFLLCESEVTQGQYQQVIGKNPSHFRSSDSLPVEMVSWFDAVQFCNALSAKDEISPYYQIVGTAGYPEVTIPDRNGAGYRLPTEAEWEYACRAGSTTKYWFGDDEARLGEFAWFDGNSEGKTHPVGEKPSNAFRLHDMYGNVREWCWDAYQKDYYKQKIDKDPLGPEAVGSEGLRIHRGGSWDSAATMMRSASRARLKPTVRSEFFGFRVARNDSGADG